MKKRKWDPYKDGFMSREALDKLNGILYESNQRAIQPTTKEKAMGILVTPDFTESVEQTQVPAGVYNVRVDSVEQKVSQKGAKYLSWKLIIFGAEGEAARQNKRPVFLTTMTSGPGAGILKRFLEVTLGTVGASLDTDAVIGKELQVTLVDRKKPDGSDGFPEVKAMKAIQH